MSCGARPRARGDDPTLPRVENAATCELFAWEDLAAALGGTGLVDALTAELPASELHPFAAMALKLTPGPPSQRPDAVYIYTDGSYPEKDSQQGPAWAIVVVSRVGYVYHFHGVLADQMRRTFPSLEDEIDPNICELGAMAWALAWLIAAKPAPRAVIEADSLLALGAATSAYRTKYDRMQALCADLLLLARQLMTVDTAHVAAHRGHPRNEVADSAAKLAARDLLPRAPPEVTELLVPGRCYAWEWLKHAPPETQAAYPPRDGTKAICHAAPSRDAQHVSAAVGAPARAPSCTPTEPSMPHTLALNLCSCNANTLTDHGGMRCPGRAVCFQSFVPEASGCSGRHPCNGPPRGTHPGRHPT